MSVFTSVKTHLYESYMKSVDKVKPTLTESQFIQEGVLTPEEFVAAGDTLVFKCKTWEWASGDPSRAVAYLPPNKQYLVTKNVRCAQRCAALEKACEGPNAASSTRTIKMDAGDDLDDDEWVTTASDATATAKPTQAAHEETIAEMEVVPTATAPAEKKEDAPFLLPLAGGPVTPADDDDDDDDDADVMELDDEDLMDEDPAVAPPAAVPTADKGAPAKGDSAMTDDGDDDVLRTRTYDLFITYDHFYRTPRVWLSGYDEQMKPLQPAQVFEDISADHAHKTVTFDEFPHLPGVQMAYIHPCKHASVMKKIIARQMEAAGSAANIQVEQYLILFIKFISAVIPTIEYDFTMEIEG